MRSTLLHEADGLRTFAVVLDKDDEAVTELVAFARENHVTGAGLTAIGACREATLAYFAPQAKQYHDIPVTTQAEVLSLAGDVATKDGEPALHAHARGPRPPRRVHRRGSRQADRRVADAGGHRHRDTRTPAQAHRRRDRPRTRRT
ncbi:hypothetical protein GCM10023320_40340 [Pseudonocardia adelaidensis]|uniref:PPC domain-containing protein n=1 Tax=Pseudonocardia adelaidensis TaxID=648754 RepID=A0ABP9NPN8_9PSEU